MFKSLLVVTAAMLFALTPSAALCARPQDTTPAAPATATKNPVKPTAEGLAKAKATYKNDCAMCHGDNGDGKSDLATSMDLKLDDWTNPAALASVDDQVLFNTIRNGKDKMPSEDAGRAKDSDVWNLIHYIRGFSKSGNGAGAGSK